MKATEIQRQYNFFNFVRKSPQKFCFEVSPVVYRNENCRGHRNVDITGCLRRGEEEAKEGRGIKPLVLQSVKRPRQEQFLLHSGIIDAKEEKRQKAFINFLIKDSDDDKRTFH